MCIADRLIRPSEILAPRYMNCDGATLVLERLGQRTLADLYDWYVDRRGGDRGLDLVRQAPVLDGWLAAAQPNVPCDSPGHGFAIGAFNLAAGLAVGSELIDSLSQDTLFPDSPCIDIAVSCLRESDLSSEMLTTISPPAACAGLFAVFEGIQQNAPGLSLVLGSAIRLLSHTGDWLGKRTKDITGSRYFFLMGLVGAGAQIPRLPDGEGQSLGCRRSRRPLS